MNKLLIGWAALLGVASAVMVANLVAKHNDADSIEQRRASATARANAEMIERHCCPAINRIESIGYGLAGQDSVGLHH
jgi:hypothetical protein